MWSKGSHWFPWIRFKSSFLICLSLTWIQWNQWLMQYLKKVWWWWNAFLWRRKKAAKWDVIQKWWVTRCGMVCNPLHDRRWSRSVESHSDVISVIPYGMPHKNKTTTSSQLWWLTTTINSNMLQWAWSTRKQNKCGKTRPFGSNKKMPSFSPKCVVTEWIPKKSS